MTGLLIVFVGAATLLWLSVFGYLLLLRSMAFRRRTVVPGLSSYPDIAIVVPTLNEERLILAKLADLRHIDYPRERIAVVVVDGGSADRTTALVQQEIERGEPIQLMRVEGAGKAQQINHALTHVPHEIVVVTDADSLLEPSCPRELVSVLVHDPETALVGAVVRPASALLEERIHWWLVNHLWWLEGEALSAAVVSGVCYAVRRATALPLAGDSSAEDAQLALTAGARGFRVRICPTAQATEVRVPQSRGELLRFRRRRGAGYVRELLRPALAARVPLGWRLAHHMRLWHALVTPRISPALVVVAIALLWTPHWHWPVLAFAAFAAPALAAVGRATRLGSGQRWWRVGLAGSRLVGLLWVALLTVPHSASPEIVSGER